MMVRGFPGRQVWTRTRAAALALVLTLAAGAIACAPGTDVPRSTAKQSEHGDSDEGATIESSSRLLTLAPNLTETVFALGLGDRVVGVDDYSNYPPGAAAKPRVGGLFDPNFEAMVALEPDLAIVLPSEADIGERLRRVGVEVLTIESETIDDVAEGMIAIAERCGIPEVGKRLAGEYRSALAAAPVSAAADSDSLGSRATDAPRAMITIGRQSGRLGGVFVAGPDTFLDELLHRLGAVNVVADAPVRYPQVGLEEVLARAPTVIIELHAAEISSEQRQALIEDWRAFPQIPAVASNRIKILGADYTLVPGPRLPLLYEQLGSMVFEISESARP